MTVLVGCVSSRAHCAVQIQLGSGIPHQALAADVHITCGSKSSAGLGLLGNGAITQK